MGAQDLVQWALSHGATLHENVEVHEDKSGFSLRTRTDRDGVNITEGFTKKPIVTCPLKLSLSAFNAFHQCPLSRLKNQHDPSHFPQLFLDKTPFHVIGKFFLCQQYLLSEDSFWFPYISSLPQPGRGEYNGGSFSSDDAEKLGTPLFWTEEELEWIRGTNMDAARLERLELWKREWSDGCCILRNEGFAGWEEFDYNLYGWASTIFSSRCFISSVLPDHVLENENSPKWMERVEKEHNSSQIVFPVVDLANHDPEAKLTWKVDKSPVPDAATSVDGFQIIAENDIPPGREVFNNYGSIKYNSELLLGYGFCLQDIKNDCIAIEFTNANWLETAHKIWQTKDCFHQPADQNSLRDGPPDSEIKRRFIIGWKTRSAAVEEETTSIAKEFQMFEHGLFDLLAIELANTSEKGYIAANPSLCLETASPDGPLARLLLATTSAVMEKLEYDRTKLLKYGNLGTPKTRAQHNANIYREGQILLLNHKITALETHLKNAYKSIKDKNHAINGNRIQQSILPPSLWTLRDAYELLDHWLEDGKTSSPSKVEELKQVLENARRVLELEPGEELWGFEVIEAGWDSTLWILWMCVVSALVTLPLPTPRSGEHEHEHENQDPDESSTLNSSNRILYAGISQWIQKLETEYPVHGKVFRQFVGDEQERETLLDILGQKAMGEADRRDTVIWASWVIREEGFKEAWPCIGVGEEEVRPLVLCIGV